jgi:hypothetical protein
MADFDPRVCFREGASARRMKVAAMGVTGSIVAVGSDTRLQCGDMPAQYVMYSFESSMLLEQSRKSDSTIPYIQVPLWATSGQPKP